MRTLAFVALLSQSLVGCGGNSETGRRDADVAGGGADDGGGPGTRRGGGGGPLTGVEDGSVGDGASAADAPAVKLDAGPSGGGTDARADIRAPDAPGAPDAPAPRDAALADAPRDTAADQSRPPDCSPGGTCEMWEERYREALARARVCNPLVKGQCLAKAQTGIRCGCQVWVNATAELDLIRDRYADAGCGRCMRACPLLPCMALVNGACHSRAGTAAEPGGGDLIPPPPGSSGVCGEASGPGPMPGL